MAALPMMLEIQTGKHKGRRVKLTETEVIVGRGEESGIRIASAEVSREHCRLIPDHGRVRVIDLNSRNGTFVDGRPVNGERMLNPGGSLTVGPLTFVLIGNEESATLKTAVALKGKSGVGDKLSDDEIANWLSDSEIPTTSPDAPTETAIIKNAPTTEPAQPVAQQPPSSLLSSSHLQVAKRREFKSVAEEAQDIIRRHYEMLAQEERAS
ncbi:FHA domain-containing protein [Planctomicrobium sp. SH661]|uniref:FHA domain-containing protein n=1 Tax=Planctomicrobium sp. SH661 TaxID=3448124 RepID=UPI003F5C2A2A